ncbi:MAG TPA: HAMP domain-containing sensor histidine kinase [Candidatus Binatia bacterium]|nr:HAMP domain-containing sensor histidine kinase [Candidatus Binatia bacterium]
MGLLETQARHTLLTAEYDQFHLYLRGLTSDPRIVSVVLLDDQDKVVASTAPAEIGTHKQLVDSGDRLWVRRPLRNAAGLLGTLAIEFSSAPIEESYRNALTEGVIIGLAGLMGIALISVSFGFFLTRRLDRVALAAGQLAQGARGVSTGVRGADEIGRLGEAFDNLPHEMLTPLTGIIGYGELLKDGPDATKPEEIRYMASRIVECGQRLHHLIQNFLIFARIEASATDPTMLAGLKASRTDDAAAVVARAARRATETQGRSRDLVIEGETGDVAMPSDYLVKIVEELVDNACKFSPRFTPVSVQTAVGDRFELTVRDQGRGMSAAEVARVEAYVQFERALYEQQGIGLGLTIARRLAEVHGGELKIDGETYHGTTVRVSLPLVRPGSPS